MPSSTDPRVPSHTHLLHRFQNILVRMRTGARLARSVGVVGHGGLGLDGVGQGGAPGHALGPRGRAHGRPHAARVHPGVHLGHSPPHHGGLLQPLLELLLPQLLLDVQAERYRTFGLLGGNCAQPSTQNALEYFIQQNVETTNSN